MNSRFVDTARLDAKDANVGRLDLTSTFYKTVYLGIGDLISTAVASYALASFSTAVGTVGSLAIFLDDTATEEVGFSFTLPKDFKVGSSILPYIQYSCTSSTGSTGAIAFGLSYNEVNASPGSSMTTMVTQEIATMGSTGVLSVLTTYFNAIGSTSLCAGSLISGCLYRNSTKAASTYCDLDAVVFGLGFIYQTDGLGSTYNTVFGK